MSKTSVRHLGLAVFAMASLVAGAETVLYVSPDGTGDVRRASGSGGGALVADAADMFGTYARSLARPDIGPVQQTVPPQGMLIVR